MYIEKILFIILLVATFSCCRNYPSLKPEEELYPSGELKSKYYTLSGYKEGEYISFYKDGTIKTKAVYHKGELNGLVQRYYPNGNIHWEVPYIMGKEYGCFKEFDENENIKLINVYYNHNINSVNIKFYKNGYVKSIKQYKEGIRYGQGYYFYNNGYQKIFSIKKQDSSAYYIEYDKLGRVIDEYRAILIGKERDTFCLDNELKFKITIMGPILNNSTLYAKLVDTYTRTPNNMEEIELDSLGNAEYKTSANELGLKYLILHFKYDTNSEKMYGSEDKVVIKECR